MKELDFFLPDNLVGLLGADHIPGNRVVEHENVVEAIMVGKEVNDEQAGSLDQRRRKAVAGLFNSDIAAFAVVGGYWDGCGAVSFNRIIGVRVHDGNVVLSSPLHVLLELNGCCVVEGEGFVQDVAVIDSSQIAVSNLDAADGVTLS